MSIFFDAAGSPMSPGALDREARDLDEAYPGSNFWEERQEDVRRNGHPDLSGYHLDPLPVIPPHYGPEIRLPNMWDIVAVQSAEDGVDYSRFLRGNKHVDFTRPYEGNPSSRPINPLHSVPSNATSKEDRVSGDVRDAITNHNDDDLPADDLDDLHEDDLEEPEDDDDGDYQDGQHKDPAPSRTSTRKTTRSQPVPDPRQPVASTSAAAAAASSSTATSSASTTNTSRKSDAWSDAEDQTCIRYMKQIYNDAALSRFRFKETRFVEISRRMHRAGYPRSSTAVKNQWNRRLRQLSRFEDRSDKKHGSSGLVTSSLKKSKKAGNNSSNSGASAASSPGNGTNRATAAATAPVPPDVAAADSSLAYSASTMPRPQGMRRIIDPSTVCQLGRPSTFMFHRQQKRKYTEISDDEATGDDERAKRRRLVSQLAHSQTQRTNTLPRDKGKQRAIEPETDDDLADNYPTARSTRGQKRNYLEISEEDEESNPSKKSRLSSQLSRPRSQPSTTFPRNKGKQRAVESQNNDRNGFSNQGGKEQSPIEISSSSSSSSSDETDDLYEPTRPRPKKSRPSRQRPQSETPSEEVLESIEKDFEQEAGDPYTQEQFEQYLQTVGEDAEDDHLDGDLDQPEQEIEQDDEQDQAQGDDDYEDQVLESIEGQDEQEAREYYSLRAAEREQWKEYQQSPGQESDQGYDQEEPQQDDEQSDYGINQHNQEDDTIIDDNSDEDDLEIDQNDDGNDNDYASDQNIDEDDEDFTQNIDEEDSNANNNNNDEDEEGEEIVIFQEHVEDEESEDEAAQAESARQEQLRKDEEMARSLHARWNVGSRIRHGRGFN